MKKITQRLISVLIIISTMNACQKKTESPTNLSSTPSASFSWKVTDTVNSPTTVAFTNTSTNATNYLWDFGDATSSNDKNPIHTFRSGKVYIVKLKITSNGVIDSAINTIVFKTNWTELGGANASNFKGMIRCLISDNSGNLYATGDFTNSKGNYYVAKWNGSKWNELGGVNNSTFNGPITNLKADASGNLYAAGYFRNGSVPNGNFYVAKWNGNNWSEVGGANGSTFSSSTIDCIATDALGNLYVTKNLGGSFGSFLAKWNGSIWSEIGRGGNYATAAGGLGSLVVDASGFIYATTSNLNGGSYLLVLDSKIPNGSIWSKLSSAVFNSNIRRLIIDASGNLYAGGDFTNGGNSYVAKWNGGSWGEVKGANSFKFNGTISDLSIDQSGNIYAGGSFYNGRGKYCVAKWNGSIWSEVGGENTSTFYSAIGLIATDRSGNLYVTNTNDNINYYILKYSNP